MEEMATIRVDVNSVRVRVAVSDAFNRFVTGLSTDHFRLYEDKVAQEIQNFTEGVSPVSVGLIFDTSFSMRTKIAAARSSAVEFLRHGDPDDEFFLVLFNERAKLIQDWTHDPREIQNKIAFSTPKGSTALFDAVYIGLDRIRTARHAKKALIVVTDGEDNNSRYTIAEIREFARETDCQIYVVGEHGEERYGDSIMKDLAQLSGGRVFFPSSINELEYFIDLIHSELRHQYILGYVPTNRKADGSWRRIVIKLEAPPGLPKLFLNHREGYYAPRR